MKISDDVLEVLSALEVEGLPHTTRIRIKAQLERKLYVKVNKVLEALGGTWSRKDQAHLFIGNAWSTQTKIDQAIAMGSITTHQDLGFFETPSELADQLVAMAGLKLGLECGWSVLEPSAGTGRIVSALLGVRASVTCVEFQEDRRRHLAAKFSGFSSAKVVDSVADFMDYQPAMVFDRVVMNPPFVKVGKGDHLDHVQHAFGMLKPGGILVSVLPSGVTFRQDNRHRLFRDWANNRGGFIPLPDGSFKASGTDVRTVVLRMEKVS